MSGRTSYHYVLCWEINGEVFSDPPACKDYTDKQVEHAWVVDDFTVVHETESGGAQ